MRRIPHLPLIQRIRLPIGDQGNSVGEAFVGKSFGQDKPEGTDGD